MDLPTLLFRLSCGRFSFPPLLQTISSHAKVIDGTITTTALQRPVVVTLANRQMAQRHWNSWLRQNLSPSPCSLSPVSLVPNGANDHLDVALLLTMKAPVCGAVLSHPKPTRWELARVLDLLAPCPETLKGAVEGHAGGLVAFPLSLGNISGPYPAPTYPVPSYFSVLTQPGLDTDELGLIEAFYANSCCAAACP